jgi:hypothetical protein
LVDTHVGHHSREGELRRSDGAKVLEESGLAEAVREMLDHDPLSGPWLHGAVNLGADGAGKEERGTGSLRDVLDVEDGKSLVAERMQEEQEQQL